MLCCLDKHAHLGYHNHTVSAFVLSGLIYVGIFKMRNYHYYTLCYSDQHADFGYYNYVLALVSLQPCSSIYIPPL